MPVALPDFERLVGNRVLLGCKFDWDVVDVLGALEESRLLPLPPLLLLVFLVVLVSLFGSFILYALLGDLPVSTNLFDLKR